MYACAHVHVPEYCDRVVIFCMDLRGLISVSDSSCYQGEGGLVRHVRDFVHKRKHYGDGSNVLGNYLGLAEIKQNILI
jgi:hypothetical protein